jgi:malonate-semialdehyde dehydrogenase (acetylating)/methylmalonate-semialdehyde dehydrogenase
MTDIQMPKELIYSQNLCGGKWQDASGKTIEVDSPYFGKKVGEIKCSTKEDIDQIVSKAKEAQILWAEKPMKERAQVLFNFRNFLLERIEEIAQVVSLENGKTLGESRAGIMKGIEVLEYALSLQNLDSGSKMEVSRGVVCEYRRKPIGVVLSITPFNFPAMVPMWTIPVSIALGNAYIWKPSEKTPLTPKWIAQAFMDAGLPEGILSIAHGEKETVESAIDHADVKAVAFVGSSPVAKAVYTRATSLGKRALCLGGAKNHIILLPDADPNITGNGISNSFTGCAGQRCMAASVLLAVGEVDKHIEKIKEAAMNTSCGNKMGAIITKSQLEFLNNAISQAEKDGAKILLDGRNPQVDEVYKDGYWLAPTIIDHVKPGTQAAKEELFGPVISIIRCNSISEAMKIENENAYGNACSVFTSSGPLAEKVLSKASAGMLGVNIGVPVPREPFSFGGINISKFGHGDITGAGSLDFWSDQIKVTTKWERQDDENWMS